MNLEELKIIWDSQTKEPLYVVPETSLHDIVWRRLDDERRKTAVRHAVESVGNGLAGLATVAAAACLAWGDPAWLANVAWLKAPVSAWDAAALFLAGVAWLFCAAYLWRARRRQIQREDNLAQSIRGDLERALGHIDFQIRIARGIVWWGLIPAWFAAGLFVLVLFHLRQTPAWGYWVIVLLMVGTFTMIQWWQHYAIRKIYEPRRRELESLRAKLVNPELYTQGDATGKCLSPDHSYEIDGRAPR